VALEQKLARNAGAPLGGLRVQLVKSAVRTNSLLKRKDYLCSNLLRAGPRQPYRNCDGGGIRLGEQIDPKITEREDSEHNQKADQHHGEHRTFYANFSYRHSLAPRPDLPARYSELSPLNCYESRGLATIKTICKKVADRASRILRGELNRRAVF